MNAVRARSSVLSLPLAGSAFNTTEVRRMYRRRWQVAAALAVLLVTLTARHADAQTSVHEQVAAAMENIRQATLAGDAERLDALMADDCTFVSPSGRLFTKPRYLAAMRGRMLVVDALSFEEVSVRVYGNAAVVTHVSDIKERIGGAPTAGRFRSTRVFVQDDRGWRLVAVQGTAMQTR